MTLPAVSFTINFSASSAGKKASPGPLYGIKGDCWSALAIALTVEQPRAA